MRKDMFEVIIERPRGDSGRGKPGRPPRELDDAPRREPISIGRGTKWLNENLAPLRRFLQRRVGRPWDEVHAEIAAQLSMRSAVQKHVLDHLRDFVELHPVFIDGKPHRATASSGKYRPLGWWRGGELYVCPRTGLLRAVDARKPRRKRTVDPDVRPLEDHRQARRIDGIWYEITFAPVPASLIDRRYCRDLLLHCRLSDNGVVGSGGVLQRAYGNDRRYAARKRQLSMRELEALG
jgi:hypothetical protein